MPVSQVMAFAVKGVVRKLETHQGKKIPGTTQPNISVDELRKIVDDALENAKVSAKDMHLSRTGVPSRTKEHPGYSPIVHRTLMSKPFTVIVDSVVKFTVDDVLEILKYRKRVQSNCEKRENIIKEVRYWRVGKPPRIIRDEVMREEARKVAEAKRLGNPIPKTIFGTDEEFDYLKSVENDKRQQMKVTLEENPSGAANLTWPEEHETWYNQMLHHSLSEFEKTLLAMEVNVNMGLNYGRDGKILRKGRVRFRCC